MHPEYNPATPFVLTVSRMIVHGLSRCTATALQHTAYSTHSNARTLPPNCERVLTYSVGYVTNLVS